jgi:protein CpxP
MTTKRIPLVMAAALVASTLGLSAALAQGNQSPTPSTPAPQHAPKSDQGMMGGGSMGSGDMMKVMGQMNRMMENCNRMMESNQHAPSAPDRTNPKNG